jgi:MarR family transcriptional regulator, transcriptional regulator for hemolysin
MGIPIGLDLNNTARVVSRAFDDALDEVDGTLPIWLILLNLKIHRPANQRELAEAVGVREATLTHHLNTMDTRGLITRTRDPANRRIHVVEITEAGEAAFGRLRDAAMAFNAKLCTGMTEEDLDSLRGLLGRLAANVGASTDSASTNKASTNKASTGKAPPWAGAAETARA